MSTPKSKKRKTLPAGVAEDDEAAVLENNEAPAAELQANAGVAVNAGATANDKATAEAAEKESLRKLLSPEGLLSTDPHEVRESAESIVKMLDEEKTKKRACNYVVDHGSYTALVVVMQNWDSSEGIQNCLLFAMQTFLHNMSCDKATQQKVVSILYNAGLLDAIVSSMNLFATFEEIQSYGILAIRNLLSKLPHAEGKLAGKFFWGKLKGAEVVDKAMKTCRLPGPSIDGIELLSNLCAMGLATTQQVKIDVIAAVSNAMKRFPKDKAVFKKGLAALKSIK